MSPRNPEPRCNACGCTEQQACTRVDAYGLPERCSWVMPGLCSACVDDAAPGWLHPKDQQGFSQEAVAHELLGENDTYGEDG